MTQFAASQTHSEFNSAEERAAVMEEQIRAFFAETNDQNIAGALVLSLIVYVVHDGIPAWTWQPALLALYGVTLARAWLIRRFHREPRRYSAAQWGRQQTIAGGMSGICWGFASVSMLAHVSTEYQLFILTVVAVSAATNASEGFSYTPPSRAFILISLSPSIIWLLTAGDRLHYILAIMLVIFVPMTIWQAQKRNRIFIAAQQLRFRNETLANELTIQRDRAEQASLAKSRFLAAASHDLRQPVQAINLFRDALLRTAMSEEQKRIAAYLASSTENLKEILDALLDISQLDAGMVKPAPEAIDSDALFRDIEAVFAPLASAKRLRFKLFFPFRELRLFTDPQLLLTLLRNLIGNAIKYTDRGGLLVGIRRREDHALIQVWDTGIGIAPQHHEAIFEEYFQVANAARDKAKGLGLGLALVRRVAKLLGIPVICRSRLGKGSLFEISVPLAKDDACARIDSEPPTECSTELPANIGQRVVVVEDDVMAAAAMRISLATLGMSVMTFHSAEEALAHPGIADTDYYLSDYRLPGLNGIQFLDAIQQRSPARIKAVLLTGDSSQSQLDHAKSNGWPVLFKPVDLASLVAAMGLRGR